MFRIDIIIVHYHAAAAVREAIDAIERDAASGGFLANVFISDNGSTAEERAFLRSLHATYLDTGRDSGYPGGINFAFPHTRSDFIVIMNEDVQVLSGCLGALHEALVSGAAVAGPEFFWDADKVFLLPCTEERTRRNELIKAAGKRNAARLQNARQHWREHARRHWRATSPIATTSLSGALLAFRRDTWKTVGPWDEGYQMYFDENDWLLRVEHAGLQSMYVPGAKAIHLHNPKLAGDPDRAQWSSESFLRFGNRYYGERFMRRLFQVGSRSPVVPEWPPASTEIEIPADAAWPVWVELTPSPFGYPAAATRLTDRTIRRWSVPALRGLPFLAGTLYLQLVDDEGHELGRYSMAVVPEREAVTA